MSAGYTRRPQTLAQVEANLRIQDAAPELFEALEAVTELLVATVTEMGCWAAEDHPKVIAARAALRKARGETQ